MRVVVRQGFYCIGRLLHYRLVQVCWSEIDCRQHSRIVGFGSSCRGGQFWVFSYSLCVQQRLPTGHCCTSRLCYQHNPLVFLDNLWSYFCQEYSVDLFVAFSINCRMCVTLRRPVMPYVGVVSLYGRRTRFVQLPELPL